MEFLKFKLSGRTAFFKKPDVNAYYYFTYGNIHKVALLGMLGAILGYNGYIQMGKDDVHPEFYEKLKHLQVSIAPVRESKGNFQKKIQSFNNSVGYASTQNSGNLIVRQQWLEDPCWDIYVKLDNDEGEKLKAALLDKTSIYLPYLGSNNHPADISKPEVFSGELAKDLEEESLDSLFLADKVELDTEEEPARPYQYKEFLPMALQETTNLYVTEKVCFTNLFVSDFDCEIFQINNKNIALF